ncbi:MAG: phosphoglucosamine mutase [Acidobacteria bacterium]|nr:MAG: phosphoglucosamine mutase [Acidobacteriota bacterium]
MKRRLFGTDGVRGSANDALTPGLSVALGRAAGSVLVRRSSRDASERSKVLIGRDTRRSGTMISAALSAGLCSAGADVIDVGVVPTPGVAFLTVEQGAAAGAVVSASHNPASDNGIKFFGPDGYKLTDEVEARIESLVDDSSEASVARADEIGTVISAPVLAAIYEAHLVSTVGEGALCGLKVILDCANGAAFESAPHAFAAAGATVDSLFDAPDGDNINAGCGSTDTTQLQSAVVEAGADLGLAFDGDADRVLAVDAAGSVVDGDQILAIAATGGLGTDRATSRVVATVMANLGFRKAMEASGIEVLECPVGDRYVIETMRRESVALGGEQSGHIIFADSSTTGDGLLTGLKLMEIMAKTGRSLKELASVMTRFPQVLINVKVRDKSLLGEAESVWSAVAEAEKSLGDQGRILLRPSGTEPLVRVMVEAGDEETAHQQADRVARVVASEIG